MVSLPGGAIGARPLIHSALASPLEASGSARFTQPSPPRSRRAARLDSLSPRLPARGERLGSDCDPLSRPGRGGWRSLSLCEGGGRGGGVWCVACPPNPWRRLTPPPCPCRNRGSCGG